MTLACGKAALTGLISIYLNPSNAGEMDSSPIHTFALLSELPAGSRNVSPNALMGKKKWMLIQRKQFQTRAHLRSHRQGKEVVHLKPGAAIFFPSGSSWSKAWLTPCPARGSQSHPCPPSFAALGAGSRPQEPCLGSVSVVLGAWPPPSSGEGDVCPGGRHCRHK